MNIKKIMAGSTVVAVVATQAMTGIVAAATPASVNTSWESAVKFMKETWLSSTANSVAEYEPMATVRREAASKLFVNFASKLFKVEPDATKVCNFSDLDKAQEWARPYILEACQMGIFKGSDGKFLPLQELTKLQFLTVLARIVNNDSSIEPAAAFNLMKTDGITKEATLTDTVRPVNRIELAMLYQRAADKYANVSTTDGKDTDGTDSVSKIIKDLLGPGTDDKTTSTWSTSTSTTDTHSNVTGWNLLITLSPKTPRAQNIPANSANVEFMTFDISAGDKDVTVKNLTFTRRNLGSRNDFDRVWLTSEGIVVSNDKSVNSSDNVTLTLNKVIKAKTKVSFTLNASMKGNANVVNQFELTSVESTAENTTYSDVISNAMTTVNYEVAELTFDRKGSPSIIDTSKEAETVGEFKLTETNSNSKKDVILKSMRFRATGGVSVDEDLANIALYVDGKKVSTATEINGNYVTFKLNNYVIADGKWKLFTIKADVVKGNDGDEITFTLRDSFDIYAIEEGTNAWASIKLEDGGSCATYTLNAGRVSLTRDTSNPSSDEYVKDTDDVLAMVAKVDTDQKVEVDSLKLFLDNWSFIKGATAADNNKEATVNNQIENVRLYVNDTLVDSVDKITAVDANNVVNGKSYYYFKSNFDIKDNDLIKIYVKLQNTARTNTKLRFKIDNSGTSNGNSESLSSVEYESDGQLVKQGKLTGTVTSNYITVVDSAAGAAVARNDGSSNNDILLAGQQNAQLMKFVINAGNSSAMKLRKLQFNFTFAGTVNYANVTNVRLVKADGSQVGSTESVNSSNKVVIDSINTDIEKNGQIQLRLVADIDVSTPNGNIQATLDKSGSTTVYDWNDNLITLPNDVIWANLTVKQNADLTVSLDGNSPKTWIIIAGTQNVDVAKFKFTATDGDVNVRKLWFKTNAGSDARVWAYEVYADGKKLDSRVANNWELAFDLGSANKIVVPANKSLVVTLKANLNSISSASETNRYIMIKLTDMDAKTAATSNDIASVDGHNIGRADHYDTIFATSDILKIRKTQPTLASVKVPTNKLVAGENTLYKFTVTADSKADVTVSQINFNVVKSFTDAWTTLDNYTLYVDGTKVDASKGSFNGTKFTFNTNATQNNDEVVAAGSSKTFELRATIGGTPLSDNDAVTTNVQEDSIPVAWNRNAVVTNASSNFVWSDNSDPAGKITAQDYFNGWKVKGLTTTSSTLEK